MRCERERDRSRPAGEIHEVIRRLRRSGRNHGLHLVGDALAQFGIGIDQLHVHALVAAHHDGKLAVFGAGLATGDRGVQEPDSPNLGGGGEEFAARARAGADRPDLGVESARRRDASISSVTARAGW